MGGGIHITNILHDIASQIFMCRLLRYTDNSKLLHDNKLYAYPSVLCIICYHCMDRRSTNSLVQHAPTDWHCHLMGTWVSQVIGPLTQLFRHVHFCGLLLKSLQCVLQLLWVDGRIDSRHCLQQQCNNTAMLYMPYCRWI